MKCSFTPAACAHASSALLVNSGPLSITIRSGSPRCSLSRSRTRTTRSPPSEVSTSIATHSRLKSSMMLRVRKTRPSASASETKSMLQRWSGLVGASSCCLLLAVEAVDQLVVDRPALAPQLLVQHPIAVARPLSSELAELRAQLRVLHPLAAVPAGRARQLDDAAGAALTDTEVRLEVTRSLAACGGRHHFFAFTAFSICTSSVRSATMCFSRRFSSSSAFSLRASLTSIPPYLLRQR